jgi:hypothetical protein
MEVVLEKESYDAILWKPHGENKLAGQIMEKIHREQT